MLRVPRACRPVRSCAGPRRTPTGQKAGSQPGLSPDGGAYARGGAHRRGSSADGERRGGGGPGAAVRRRCGQGRRPGAVGGAGGGPRHRFAREPPLHRAAPRRRARAHRCSVHAAAARRRCSGSPERDHERGRQHAAALGSAARIGRRCTQTAQSTDAGCERPQRSQYDGRAGRRVRRLRRDRQLVTGATAIGRAQPRGGLQYAAHSADATAQRGRAPTLTGVGATRTRCPGIPGDITPFGVRRVAWRRERWRSRA